MIENFLAFWQSTFGVLVKTAVYLTKGLFWKSVFIYYFQTVSTKYFKCWRRKLAHFSKLISNCPTKLFLEKTVFLNFQTFTFLSPFFLEWNVLNLLAEVMRQDGRNNFLTCLEEQFEWKKIKYLSTSKNF